MISAELLKSDSEWWDSDKLENGCPQWGTVSIQLKRVFETCPVWTKKDTKNGYSSGIADFQLFYTRITFLLYWGNGS